MDEPDSITKLLLERLEDPNQETYDTTYIFRYQNAFILCVMKTALLFWQT